MAHPEPKRIIIIAGPNGAGKTTFAREYLPGEAHLLTFFNADLIAAGLSPFHAELAQFKAARLMLELMEDAVSKGESFAFETTLSGRAYLERVKDWRKLGYHVTLLFLKLDRVELAISRVALRVSQGGHDIPETMIRRRFTRGLANLSDYKLKVDSWVVYDKSTNDLVLLEEGFNGSA